MDIIIIGGGASGYMAAITAAELVPSANITILEKQTKVLAKVRISGGGRCNVTHRPLPHAAFMANYPRGKNFIKKLLPIFDAQSTIDWFSKRGVTLKIEDDGRVFPTTNSSETIIRCLLDNAHRLGILVITSANVTNITCHDADLTTPRFEIKTALGGKFYADSLLVACGGKPKYSDYQWLPLQQDLVVPPYPSLFTFNVPQSPLSQLPGVSVQDAEVKILQTKQSWRGPVLITHWGFSGPAVLKLSAWGAKDLAELQYQFDLKINWIPDVLPEQCVEQLQKLKLQRPKISLQNANLFGLPNRLWSVLLNESGLSETAIISETKHKSLHILTNSLTNSQFRVSGKTTFKDEFVTCGGVALHSINQATMESKSVPRLYFSGEILDVDGITGGFNFQFAWTTGYIAGQSMVAKLLKRE